jgi:hypothetical protein
MNHLSQCEAFAYNKSVQDSLQAEESVCYEDALDNTILNDIKEFCIDYLGITTFDVFRDTQRAIWFRKGSVDKTEFVQTLNREVLQPITGIDDLLIGDTAFCINYPPHDLHIDCRDFRTDTKNKSGIIGTKSVVVPVEINTTDYPKFYTSNQYFYGPTTRLRNGCEQLDSTDPIIADQKNSGIYFSYDYKNDGVLNLDYDNPLSYEWWEENIDAPSWVPYSTFDGISIEKEHTWKPGNIIVFDNARVHWGGNLLKRGATYKMGLSLNYGYKK